MRGPFATGVPTVYSIPVTFAAGTRFGDGTAAVPTISFVNDQDTGLFRGPNNGVGIADGGLCVCEFFVAFGACIVQMIDHGIVIQTVRGTDGAGSDILLQVGAAQGAGPSAGGNVKLIPGAGVGGGANGKILCRNTSDGATVASIDDTGRVLAGDGTAALPSLAFTNGSTQGFFRSSVSVGVAVAGVHALTLSAFGAGIVLAPDRGLTMLPQRQTNGVGDNNTILGGTALGGTNAGGNLDLVCGAAAGGGTNGLIRVLAVDLVTINFTMNNAGDIAHTNGDEAHARKTMTLANGANNDVANTAGVFFKVSGPTAAFNITGLAAGTDGQVIEILNLTGQNMTLNHANAGSVAANRITTLTGADVATVGNGWAKLRYDTSINNWVLVSHQP